MKIWLIQQGEELPTDPGNPRLLRTGILAEMLADRGHYVTYWTSTFSHARKVHRFHADTELQVRDNYTIKLIHSPGYRKNVSVSRIYDHWLLARKFRRQVPAEDKPDIILCSMPTIDLSLAATEYGKRHQVPVVLDIRDKWPDIFVELAPLYARPMLNQALAPIKKKLYTACKNSDSIIGITEGFLQWGLDHANREKSAADGVFFHAYKTEKPSDRLIDDAIVFWEKEGIQKDTSKLLACFFGALGPQSEITTVIEAARLLSYESTPITLVLCGKGEYHDRFKREAKDLANVIFPGWVNSAQIWTLMRMSNVALAPIKSNINYIDNIPNKIVEYLSAGLPIISSLRGTVERLLHGRECGLTYTNSKAEMLAEILYDLFQNRKKIDMMALNALKLFQEQFASENVYRSMIDHLELKVLRQFTRNNGHFLRAK